MTNVISIDLTEGKKICNDLHKLSKKYDEESFSFSCTLYAAAIHCDLFHDKENFLRMAGIVYDEQISINKGKSQ